MYYVIGVDCVKVIHTQLGSKNNRVNVNKNRRERRASNERLRLANNLRSRFSHALLNQLTNKTTKTEDLLGISFNNFEKKYEF